MEFMVCIDGVEVTTVADGEEALRIAVELKESQPDALVTVVVGDAEGDGEDA